MVPSTHHLPRSCVDERAFHVATPEPIITSAAHRVHRSIFSPGPGIIISNTVMSPSILKSKCPQKPLEILQFTTGRSHLSWLENNCSTHTCTIHRLTCETYDKSLHGLQREASSKRDMDGKWEWNHLMSWHSCMHGSIACMHEMKNGIQAAISPCLMTAHEYDHDSTSSLGS